MDLPVDRNAADGTREIKVSMRSNPHENQKSQPRGMFFCAEMHIHPQPYRLRLNAHGLSHGGKTVRRTVF